TGVNPTFIGKPESIIMEQALEQIGSAKNETLMVGDNYHTDILAGMNAGLDTLMVFTGVTPHSDLPTLEKKLSIADDIYQPCGCFYHALHKKLPRFADEFTNDAKRHELNVSPCLSSCVTPQEFAFLISTFLKLLKHTFLSLKLLRQ